VQEALAPAAINIFTLLPFHCELALWACRTVAWTSQCDRRQQQRLQAARRTTRRRPCLLLRLLLLRASPLRTALPLLLLWQTWKHRWASLLQLAVFKQTHFDH
jgi:hypothetical protein